MLAGILFRDAYRTLLGAKCTHCGHVGKVRACTRRRTLDKLAMLVLVFPYRCESCMFRFYRFPRWLNGRDNAREKERAAAQQQSPQ